MTRDLGFTPGEPFNPGDGIVPGFVAGVCGHRVAGSEWRAGFRTCERCPVPDDWEDDDEPQVSER